MCNSKFLQELVGSISQFELSISVENKNGNTNCNLGVYNIGLELIDFINLFTQVEYARSFKRFKDE